MKPNQDGTYGARSRLEKLGVKPGHRVAVIGVEDADFLEELGRVVAKLEGLSANALDVIFYAAGTLAALDRLGQLRGRIAGNGAIWVVSRKGKAATLKDTEVMAAAKRAGLVDNKVVGFSATHTALRLVVPLALRQR